MEGSVPEGPNPHVPYTAYQPLSCTASPAPAALYLLAPAKKKTRHLGKNCCTVTGEREDVSHGPLSLAHHDHLMARRGRRGWTGGWVEGRWNAGTSLGAGLEPAAVPPQPSLPKSMRWKRWLWTRGQGERGTSKWKEKVGEVVKEKDGKCVRVCVCLYAETPLFCFVRIHPASVYLRQGKGKTGPEGQGGKAGEEGRPRLFRPETGMADRLPLRPFRGETRPAERRRDGGISASERTIDVRR